MAAGVRGAAPERCATVWQIGNEKVSLFLAPVTKMLKPSCAEVKKPQNASPRSSVSQGWSESGLALRAGDPSLAGRQGWGRERRGERSCGTGMCRGPEQRPGNAAMGPGAARQCGRQIHTLS